MIQGIPDWARPAGPCTKRRRESSITLTGAYACTDGIILAAKGEMESSVTSTSRPRLAGCVPFG